MKNKSISGFGKSYIRLSKVTARKMFDNGNELLVMSIDRNPVESLTSPRVYYKGCKSYMMGCVGKSTIETFEDLMEDFAWFLESDGYGHMPQRYDARHYRFSYWIKND